MFRYAKLSDRDELRSLWQLCFNDSESFADWFFTERFLPEYCAVWEESGRIACALHSLPLHMRVRSAIIPCAMIAGIATLPEYRGRGLMRAVMTAHLKTLRGLSVPLVSYRPVDFAYYRSLGHYAVADKLFLTKKESGWEPNPAITGISDVTVCEIDAREHLAALYMLYCRAAAPYSGMIARSYADFALKYRDYASDGACCAAAFDRSELAGYCFYYAGEHTLEGVELLAADADAYAALFAFLSVLAAGRELKLALPPDAVFDYNSAEVITAPRTAAGVTDVSALLRSTLSDVTGLDGFAVEIRDGVLPENSGVYDLRGDRTQTKPRLALDPGRLAQFIFGYRSVFELAQRGEAEIFDPGAVDALDKALPKQCCYCIDEY